LSAFGANFSFDEIVTRSLVRTLFRIEFAFVLVFAELNSGVVLGEIFVSHPESSIVFFHKSYLFLGFFSPRVRVVRPGSFPFEGAPWVSKLNNVFFFTRFIRHGCSLDQSISMASN